MRFFWAIADPITQKSIKPPDITSNGFRLLLTICS